MKKAKTVLFYFLITALLIHLISVGVSAAQTKIFVLGDSDGDKVVTVLDATLIQKTLASIEGAAIEDEDVSSADVDSDTAVTVVDACYIQKWLAHIEVEYPIGSTSSKTWHEAEYEYIDHPAEYQDVWVVDQEADSYEEPVYGNQARAICNQCGSDITTDPWGHMEANIDTCWSYHTEYVKVQTGTRTVNVPERGHWERQKVNDAWTEKRLVREAGYY